MRARVKLRRAGWTTPPWSAYPVAMTVDAVTRDPDAASRARDRRRSGRISGGRVTVEMIGVKWRATRHGDLRARLRAAVVRDGFDSAADWLSDALARRDAELSPASAAHPLAR